MVHTHVHRCAALEHLYCLPLIYWWEFLSFLSNVKTSYCFTVNKEREGEDLEALDQVLLSNDDPMCSESLQCFFLCAFLQTSSG